MTVRFRPAALAALVALLLAPLAAPDAQGIRRDTPIRPVTRTLAITDARVVVAPGRVLDRATVVVRDGRIEAVGEDVEVPFDAHVIEADTLTVYAGFVDAFGYAGVPKTDDEERPEGIDPGAPPRRFAGIVPDRDVRETYAADDAAIKGLREAGFTVAHVAPREGLFSGQGAVVLLRELGRLEEAPAVVLAGPVSFVARLDPASGVYPATPMGVLAVMRETVENARRRAAAQEAFDDGASARPRFDPVLDAVAPVLDGERLFVFVAESPLDGFRALRASSEMGLDPVLAGVSDVAPLLDRLRQSGAPVFAPLALPDTVKADSAALALPLPSTTPGGVSFVTSRRTFSFRDTDAENTALTGQRRAAVARVERAPALLDSTGVPFAFATLDVKPGDIHANLRRMVAAGLSPDAALGALTVAPARLLGLDREVGTVEEGKLANLVVTTGDLFTSDSAAVRLVVVDGVEYEVEAGGGPEGADPDAVVQATGTWDYEVSTPGGNQEGTFTITGAPGSLTGEFSSQGEVQPMTGVTLAGNVLTMSFQSDDAGTITITGTIDDDEFEGSAEVASFGSFPMTATRRPE
jgi:imidazolonepropionase-like amidohydrolase